MTAADHDAARELCAFIDASPSPFHAVASAATRLEAAGFTQQRETEAWDVASGSRYLVRDGSLVAWSLPAGTDPAAPWRLIGAHTDSPNLRVKPQPDVGSAGTRQLAVEVYGGALLNSWLGRDLGLSGRLGLHDGSTVLVRVDEPVLHIPQLAIHLDREITTAGLHLNPQAHLNPLWGIGDVEAGGFRTFVAAAAGVTAQEVVAWEVMVHDLGPSQLAGRDCELLSAPRLDNLCSCWAAISALTASPAPDSPTLVVLFDHEEVGSTSSRGADSPLLEATLERIVTAAGGTRAQMRQALAGSLCASADMAHATHPNYAERHEPEHWIALGGGPVVKTNVNQRYATDARSAARFTTACERAGVPFQWYSHRADLPCGSTIGPITAAALGVSVVDVG
ncbi:MAG: M18 family aminopeptidase, partial [Acidimicrobiales bacterium]